MDVGAPLPQPTPAATAAPTTAAAESARRGRRHGGRAPLDGRLPPLLPGRLCVQLMGAAIIEFISYVLRTICGLRARGVDL